MPSAGELLRDERLKRNKSLGDIAAQTRISSRYLQAIETDRLEELPGDFFYRSFLRQYATALELDDRTTSQILSSVAPAPETNPIPAMSEAWEQAHTNDLSRFRAPTGLAVTLFIAVLVGCSGLYAWWQKTQSDRESEAVATAAQPSSAPSGRENPVSASTPTAAAPLAAEPPASVPQTASPATQAPSAGTSVDLAATEETWVSLTSGGKTIFSGLLDPAESRNFSISESAKLLTGNAGGLDVKVNGRPIGAIGPRGQIRIILFSGTEYRVVEPADKL